MNPKNAKEASALFGEIKKGVIGIKNLEIVVCPPFVLLVGLKAGVNLKLGAQNCHWETQGAFTGEISTSMLADLKIDYVILGHSERRRYFGETDEAINLKIKSVLKLKLKPILCIGEKEGEDMGAVIEKQLVEGLSGINFNQLKEIAIAYEPVWAIGTGKACSPDNALSAALFIKLVLTKLYSRFLAEKVQVLYGGSVDSGNSASYIKESRMNGLLVGGNSLNAEEFLKIVKNVEALNL